MDPGPTWHGGIKQLVAAHCSDCQRGSDHLKQPVRIPDGDVLRVECEWDNSGSNQPLIAGERMTSQDLQWGDGTRDEMCLGILYAAPAD